MKSAYINVNNTKQTYAFKTNHLVYFLQGLLHVVLAISVCVFISCRV